MTPGSVVNMLLSIGMSSASPVQAVVQPVCAGVVGDGVGSTGGVDGPPPESKPFPCSLVLCWLVAEAIILTVGVGVTDVAVVTGLLPGVIVGSTGVGVSTEVVGVEVTTSVGVAVTPTLIVGERTGVAVGDVTPVSVGRGVEITCRVGAGDGVALLVGGDVGRRCGVVTVGVVC